MQQQTQEEPQLFDKLTKDLKEALYTMTPKQARFLVDAYYIMQDHRIRNDNQIRSMVEEPHLVLKWMGEQSGKLEKQVQLALKHYAESQHMGRWAMAQKGIGPVIASGLLAHIEMTPWRCSMRSEEVDACTEKEPHEGCKRERIETAGHIWNYAGLNPDQQWNKGEKRPWNASLKTLAWIIGESFVKISGYEDGFYGHLYTKKKELYLAKNETGGFADAAKAKLEKFNIGKSTDAYKAYSKGKFPPAHIHAMAKRYAVKIFLSHWHAEAYRHEFKTEPSKPFAIAILGHAHFIEAPITILKEKKIKKGKL